MRNLLLPEIDQYRLKTPGVLRRYGSYGDENSGVFIVRAHRTKAKLMVIAASDEGWDHVSVSCRKRCPRWEEMSQIHRLFFKESETAMQLHVPVGDHLDIHQFVLHLWRPWEGAIPLPPKKMV